MGLIVQKFGGSSVADAKKLERVAKRIIETYQQGNEVVVVVSAQGDTTDDLIAKAKEVNPNPSKREMDVLMSAGEQMSMSLLAMTIQHLGFPAVSLTGWQAGVSTSSAYGNARIKDVHTDRIRAELDRKNIVIVAGFQGINKYDDITTLGRGGSDTSAVALAAKLKADLCQIFTDVDGVYTADPRKIKNAKKLDYISFDEMLELATLGAQVLHNRSVEMAKKYNVNLEVLTSYDKVPGTKVSEVSKLEKTLFRGVAKDTDVVRFAVIGLPAEPGVAFIVFSLLSKNNINVDIILQSVGRNNTKDISFTVSEQNMELTKKLLTENLEFFNAHDLSVDNSIAKVSIVGAGMVNNPGVAAQMFEALSDANINIHMISTSEIKVSVLISKEDADKAVAAIHDKFIH